MLNLFLIFEKYLQKNWGDAKKTDATAKPEVTPDPETPLSIEKRIRQYQADQVAQLRISDTALHEAKKLDVFKELAEAAQEEFGGDADNVNVMQYLNNITQGISRYIPAPVSQAAVTLHEMQYGRMTDRQRVIYTAGEKRAASQFSQEDSWRTDPVLKEVRNEKRKEILERSNAQTAVPYAGMTPEELKAVLQARDDANNARVYGRLDAMRNAGGVFEPGLPFSDSTVDEMHVWIDRADVEAAQAESVIEDGTANEHS